MASLGKQADRSMKKEEIWMQYFCIIHTLTLIISPRHAALRKTTRLSILVKRVSPRQLKHLAIDPSTDVTQAARAIAYSLPDETSGGVVGLAHRIRTSHNRRGTRSAKNLT
ncbi:hypothetical protein F4814DRAFT_454022 [Daldinia grandis]|nr:hypothetical protein F4814DRAFT_454022 [Daldinia grandis]